MATLLMRSKYLAGILTALCLCGMQSRAAVDVMEADLLCAYSPDAASRSGGELNIQVNLANTVAGANVIQANSGTGVRWHIAGYCMSTNNPVSQDNAGVLGLLANDASFQDVRNFAAAIGADDVVYHSYNTGAAGNAYQPGNYAVMGVQWMWYIVFAHEVGHNYGANHADGIGFTANGAPYRTVMLHNYCGGTSLPYYSNPNLSYLGVQLQGALATSCGTGNLLYNGNNAKQVGSYALTMSGNRQRVVVGPALTNVIYHWQFTNAPAAAPAGTIVLDSASGTSATVRGIGATFTGTALRIPGGTTGNTTANSIAAYIDLPNGIISSQTNLTIEIWATPLSSPNYARIFDFGRTVQAGDGLGAAGEYTGTPGTAAPGSTQSSDNVMLSAAIGTDIGQQRFEAKLNGTAVTLNSAMPTTAGTPQLYTVTFTDGAGSYGAAGGRWQWYRNGDPVSFLDVNFHLADLEDVNNWLGRSMWSTDSMANNEYAEVRISNVALTRQQVQANFRLGANFVATNIALTANDPVNATSFAVAGRWDSGAAPTPAGDYDTSYFTLRTPATSGSFVFQGNSLELSTGGALQWNGTASSTITVTNLIFNGGTVQRSGSGTFTLAGTANVASNGGTFYGANGGITLSASLTGNGPVTYLGNTTTLANNNADFAGKHLVGAGGAGTLAIDSESRLGLMPATLVPDLLTLDNGTLQTTTSIAFTNSNRGIRLSYNGGTFSPNAGTTLLLSNNVSGIGNLSKAGQGTLILTGSNSFTGPIYVDTGSTTANDGVLRVTSPSAVPAGVPAFWIRNNNSGASTLQLDGSGGNITLAKKFFVSCRNAGSAAIQNLSGTNTISGNVYLDVGGNLFTIQSDSGLLIFSGAHQYTGSLSGGRTYNFTGAGDHLVSGRILNSTNGAPIGLTKSGAGTLTLGGVNTYTNSTTVSGGTLLVNGSVACPVNVTSGALGGNGVVGGAVSFSGATTLSPGTSIGRLTVNNNLTLAPGTTTRMEISHLAAATNDVLAVSGTLSFNGALVVTNIDGTLEAGDTFTLFNAGVRSQWFSSVSLPELQPGLRWNTNALAGTGVLSVEAITSPLISISSSNSALSLQFNTQPGVTYVLQSATGLELPVVWVNVWTNGGDGQPQSFEPSVNAAETERYFRLIAR